MPSDVTPPPYTPPPREPSLPRFQFSLRHQLIAVTIFCVLLGIGATFGPTALVFIWFPLLWVVPVPLVVAALFARGELRVFSIGALIPWIACWTNTTVPFVIMQPGPTSLAVLLIMGFVVGISGFCGWLAVRTRRWLERNSGEDAEK